MGNPKQKWTQEEEEALRAGVAKHGTGKWKDIQRDPEFNKFLFSRSNIDLKDKWRNMTGGASGQGQRDKSRAKAKASSDAPPTLPNLPNAPNVPVSDEATAEPVPDGAPKIADDGKSAARYNAMIFEALSTLKEPNGSDTGAIFSYIERKHEVPQKFRRLLSSRLRRLVAQDKLEKVQNCFKIKEITSFGTKTPAPKEQDVRPRQLQPVVNSNFVETVDEAALAAAYKIAEAENKSFVAAEAVKEAERVSKMAEDADAMLRSALGILEKCNVKGSRDEMVLVT
ncbi:single myb histone 4-like isoform X1 [Rhodamnia argentea]|uniref:MYB transcription factor n=1 Tax=Rhodamnia argentea TaxID=178133 RepID=A0A8B8P7S6_9MYRT|nr:single myb histone 4-like isoform X1 [Rhodamnia argentea]